MDKIDIRTKIRPLRENPALMHALIFSAAVIIASVAGYIWALYDSPPVVSLLPSGLMSGGIKGAAPVLLRLCASSIIQVLFIFAAGFSMLPSQLCACLFIFRGLSLGYSLKLCVASMSVPVWFSFVSYAAVTVFLIVFAAVSVVFSYKLRRMGSARKIRRSKIMPAQAVCFLMVSGAVFIMRAVPYLFIG